MNNSHSHVSPSKSQSRGKSHSSQEQSTGNISETEVKDDDAMVNAQDLLHYLL